MNDCEEADCTSGCHHCGDLAKNMPALLHHVSSCDMKGY
eukprot:gene18708-25231_t